MDFSRHPGVTRVYDIEYQPLTAENYTEADAQTILAELTKKFGPPSAHLGSTWQWCPAGAAYPMGPCPGVHAQLGVEAMTSLLNTDLNAKAQAAIEKYLENLKHPINTNI